MTHHKAPKYLLKMLHLLFCYIFPIRWSSRSNISALVKILIMYLKHIAVLFVLPSGSETPQHVTPSPSWAFPWLSARGAVGKEKKKKGATGTSKLSRALLHFLHSREGHVCTCIPAFEELSHSHSTDGLGSSTKPAIGTVITDARKARWVCEYLCMWG